MSDASRTSDAQLLAKYRERFHRGPIGLWTTWLGAGWDVCYGCQFEFRQDGAGRAYSWDTGNDIEPEEEILFTWRSISDCAIHVDRVGEAVSADDWGTIRYDFAFRLSKYGGDRILAMYQVGHYGDDNPGFWWSPNPVVVANENPHVSYVAETPEGRVPVSIVRSERRSDETAR